MPAAAFLEAGAVAVIVDVAAGPRCALALAFRPLLIDAAGLRLSPAALSEAGARATCASDGRDADVTALETGREARGKGASGNGPRHRQLRPPTLIVTRRRGLELRRAVTPHTDR